MQASRLVKLPEGLDEKLAAAGMLQGMTARTIWSTIRFGSKRVTGSSSMLAPEGSVFCSIRSPRSARGSWSRYLRKRRARVREKLGADEAIVYTHAGL